MENEFSYKPYLVSNEFNESRQNIYEYSFYNFGYLQAERYKQKIRNYLDTLNINYSHYPECRHLVTKSRKYRNIIFDAHLIIYRITDNRIEVLDIIHSASGIGKIKQIRKIKLIE
jgi:plasmid stabilization system protein ParE